MLGKFTKDVCLYQKEKRNFEEKVLKSWGKLQDGVKIFHSPPPKKNNIFKNHNQLEGGDRGGGVRIHRK